MKPFEEEGKGETAVDVVRVGENSFYYVTTIINGLTYPVGITSLLRSPSSTTTLFDEIPCLGSYPLQINLE